MRQFFFFLFICVQSFLFADCNSSHLRSVTKDYFTAKELSRAYGLPIALCFLGSDWDENSASVLNVIKDTNFQQSISNKFIFTILDFPELNDQSATNIKVNNRLKDKYHVKHLPHVVILSPELKEITSYDALPHNAPFHEVLKDAYASHLKISSKLQDVNSLDYFAVCDIYNEIEEKQLISLKKEFLEKVPLTSQPTELLINSYQENLFANQHEKASAYLEALKKQKRMTKEQELQLCLIDYQFQVSENKSKAIELLKKKAKEFTNEVAGAWQLHLLLSEHYLDNDKLLEAHSEAKSSLFLASKEKKKDIQKIINVIEQKMKQESSTESLKANPLESQIESAKDL